MARDTAQRIADRNVAAKKFAQKQSFFKRFVGNIGLSMANGIDHMTGWMGNNSAVFMGGTVSGLARGALFGAAAALILITAAPAGFIVASETLALIGLTAILSSKKAGIGAVALGLTATAGLAAMPLLLGPSLNILFASIVSATAVGFGVYDGQKALENHLYNDAKYTIPDIIAQYTWAVPKTANIFNLIANYCGKNWITDIAKRLSIKAPQETQKPNYKAVVREAREPRVRDEPEKPFIIPNVSLDRTPADTEAASPAQVPADAPDATPARGSAETQSPNSQPSFTATEDARRAASVQNDGPGASL